MWATAIIAGFVVGSRQQPSTVSVCGTAGLALPKVHPTFSQVADVFPAVVPVRPCAELCRVWFGILDWRVGDLPGRISAELFDRHGVCRAGPGRAVWIYKNPAAFGPEKW